MYDKYQPRLLEIKTQVMGFLPRIHILFMQAQLHFSLRTLLTEPEQPNSSGARKPGSLQTCMIKKHNPKTICEEVTSMKICENSGQDRIL